MWSFNTAWSNFPITSGVYAIVNILNGKKYVGSTKCFKERFAEHRSQYGSYISINQCCKSKLHSAYGFLWKYNKDYRNIFDVIKPLDDTRNKRAVYQIDKNNDCIINEFSSIKDAAIAMGNLANRSAINRCCLGSKRTAFGFKWKYKYN